MYANTQERPQTKEEAHGAPSQESIDTLKLRLFRKTSPTLRYLLRILRAKTAVLRLAE